MPVEQHNFFGLKITSFSKEELLESFQETWHSNKSAVFYGYSMAVLSYLNKYEKYLETTEKFDFMVTDGHLLYILAKYFGVPLKFEISIPRLVLLALEEADFRNQRVMMVGGTPESNHLAAINLKRKYQNIQICKGRDGYFSDKEDLKVIESVKSERPNLLLLGFPTPHKQEFALKVRGEISKCIIVPCGGMIDVLAGKEKLTPLWIKKIGLASLYRHIQHPKRLLELFGIYLKTIRVFFICFYLKKIKKTQNISIPKIVG